MGKLDETRDLDLSQPHAPTVSGVAAVAKRIRRRLTTRRGTHPWWKDFGTDLRQYLNSKTPAWRIAKDAEFEILKDEQITACAVAVEILDGGRRIRIVIAAVCSATKDFRFTMDITQAAGSLVALQAAA